MKQQNVPEIVINYYSYNVHWRQEDKRESKNV